MFTCKGRLFGVLAAAALVCVQAGVGASPLSPEQQYEALRKSIEANCADCYGASKEKFVESVKALESLIARGFDDPAAEELLATSYRTWALAYAGDGRSEESANLLLKERKIYERLVKEQASNAQLWFAYARTLSDPAAQLQSLKRAESLAPDDAAIQDYLGMVYAYGLRKPREAETHFERAIALAERHPKLTYMEHLARLLESTNRVERAAQVRHDAKTLLEGLEEADRARLKKVQN